MLNNIIEECYSVQLTSNGKYQAETNKIINEAVSTFDGLMKRVQDGKRIANRSEKEKHYEAISNDLEKSSLHLISKLNRIN